MIPATLSRSDLGLRWPQPGGGVQACGHPPEAYCIICLIVDACFETYIYSVSLDYFDFVAKETYLKFFILKRSTQCRFMYIQALQEWAFGAWLFSAIYSYEIYLQRLCSNNTYLHRRSPCALFTECFVINCRFYTRVSPKYLYQRKLTP